MPHNADYQPDESFAIRCDRDDPLSRFRDRFHIPLRSDGRPVIYFAGNSLGLQPKGVRERVLQELDDWAALGVDGHFRGETPWYSYHEIFRESGARLVGAQSGEVVMMNSLTVNLHLMMTTFYRPIGAKNKVLMVYPAFPSDTYAVKTHLRSRGVDPNESLIVAKSREGEQLLRDDDIESVITRDADDLALVLLDGVNYFTGQAFDLPCLATVAQRNGVVFGLDLAHAAGNIPLSLHGWGVDFAVWCNYKYLNSGPGAVAGCFVHEKHGKQSELPRLAGWWGNDPDTRFRMHLQPEFIPRLGADGWQVSNPPILSLAPVRASLDLFDEAGMAALRAKSEQLTGYLMYLIDGLSAEGFEIITPREPRRHGCQASIVVKDRARERFDALHAEGVVCDFREPNVIRVAPVPLYNTFHEVWRFAQILAKQHRQG